MPVTTLKDWLRRAGYTAPKKTDGPTVKRDGDRADISGPATQGEVSLADSEALMCSRGFDPEEWEVRSATVNEWEGPAPDGEVRTFHQLKIQLVKRVPTSWVFPAVDVKPRPPAKKQGVGASSFLAVIVG